MFSNSAPNSNFLKIKSIRSQFLQSKTLPRWWCLRKWDELYMCKCYCSCSLVWWPGSWTRTQWPGSGQHTPDPLILREKSKKKSRNWKKHPKLATRSQSCVLHTSLFFAILSLFFLQLCSHFSLSFFFSLSSSSPPLFFFSSSSFFSFYSYSSIFSSIFSWPAF